MTHLAAQGSGRLRGRIGAAKRWHGEAPAELYHALKIALTAEGLVVSLGDEALSQADADFIHRRVDELVSPQA